MRKIYAFLSLALLAPMLHANPSADEVIDRAREYLGGESVLKEISSICYEAEFSTAEGETGTIKIIFQKPLQQRVEILRGEVGEVTALNDFEAWRKTYDPSDKRKWSVTLLDPAKIRELQANTWENLNFFSGIERRRGWIENAGPATIDDKSCVELVFNHPHGIQFTRFFDVQSGRLLMTRTHEGAEIREKGEIWVDGVLFPETISMSKEGKILNEIHFKKVTLNEKFDEDLFRIPSLAP